MKPMSANNGSTPCSTTIERVLGESLIVAAGTFFFVLLAATLGLGLSGERRASDSPSALANTGQQALSGHLNQSTNERRLAR